MKTKRVDEKLGDGKKGKKNKTERWVGEIKTAEKKKSREDDGGSMKEAKRIKMEGGSKEQGSTGSMVLVPDKNSGRPADELVRTRTTLSLQKRDEDSAMDG